MASSSSVSAAREFAGRSGLRVRELEGILQGVGDGLIIQERAGAIVWANDAAARLFGMASAAELVCCANVRMRCELTDEAGRALDLEDLPGARLLRGEAFDTAVVRLCDRATGRVAWASIRATLVPTGDEHPQRAASIWRDCSGERRCRESARYLARATQILSESIDYEATLARLARVLVPEFADWYSVDLIEAGKIRAIAVEHVNPAKLAIAREIHDKYPPRLDDSFGIGAVARTGRSELRNGEAIDELFAKYRYADDKDLEVVRKFSPRSWLIVPLKTPERTIGTLKLLISESDRRYDEHDVATAEELARRIAIAIENARAYREAREAIRLRDEFLVLAGHELRTPVTALKLQLHGADGSLQRHDGPSGVVVWASRLKKAMSQVERLQVLIERMLDVSYVASRRFVLDRSETDLAKLWRQVIERHASEATRAGSVVSFTSTGCSTGRCDAQRIDQVFTSLLGNALKYGCGKPVQISLEGDGTTVKSFVRDEGLGIDPTEWQRMFNRFERAVSVRNYGGFGLGLWIARELVEAHGGTIGFESEPGRGSTFWIELPCASGTRSP